MMNKSEQKCAETVLPARQVNKDEDPGQKACNAVDYDT
jgi:hypothetical protein